MAENDTVLFANDAFYQGLRRRRFRRYGGGLGERDNRRLHSSRLNSAADPNYSVHNVEIARVYPLEFGIGIVVGLHDDGLVPVLSVDAFNLDGVGPIGSPIVERILSGRT